MIPCKHVLLFLLMGFGLDAIMTLLLFYSCVLLLICCCYYIPKINVVAGYGIQPKCCVNTPFVLHFLVATICSYTYTSAHMVVVAFHMLLWEENILGWERHLEKERGRKREEERIGKELDRKCFILTLLFYCFYCL